VQGTVSRSDLFIDCHGRARQGSSQNRVFCIGLPEQPALGGTLSWAADPGNDGLCPNNDQRGVLRADDDDLNQSFLCDIGAFEFFIPRADLHVNDVIAPNGIAKGGQFELMVEMHNDFANTVAEGVGLLVSIPGGLDVSGVRWAHAGGVLSDCVVNGGQVLCEVGDMAAKGVDNAWLRFHRMDRSLIAAHLSAMTCRLLCRSLPGAWPTCR